jgi:hypothetical protein
MFSKSQRDLIDVVRTLSVACDGLLADLRKEQSPEAIRKMTANLRSATRSNTEQSTAATADQFWDKFFGPAPAPRKLERSYKDIFQGGK